MISLADTGRLTLFLGSLAGAAMPANAQVAAGGPPTREEITRAPVGPRTPPASRLTVEGGIERAPCPLADPRFADVTVTLSQVMFDNLRVVSPEILRPAYESLLGRSVPIAAVCEIRDAAATILRREGYLAAVQVPAQRIEDGIVHFDVLMAKLVQIQVRGDAGRSERLIAGYLDALKRDEVFNEKNAERYLLLARDLPGYDVRLTLRPAGTVPGEVLGEVTVARTPFAVDANIQNYGSKEVGRFGGLIRGEAYGLLGVGDRLSLGYFSTADFKEQQVLQGGYDMRVGSEGLTLGGRLTYAWTRPDLGGGADIRSRTLLGSFEGSFPFIRAQAITLRGAMGLDLINQRVRLPAGLRTQDRLRIYYARLDLDAIDRRSIGNIGGYSTAEPRWRIAGSLELREGLSFLGASDGCGPAPYARCFTAGAVPPSRIDGRADAIVVRLIGQLEYRPVPLITFALSPRAQVATKPLFSFEEFSAGNYTVGRGYDPGSLVGDSGAGFQLEIRVGSLAPRTRTGFSIQPYAFYDQAWVSNKNGPAAPVANDPQELSSIGAGLRATIGDFGRLDVALAKPLDRVGLQTRRGDARLLVSLTTRLWPWAR
ncbi:MAG: putative hemolysin activation/secretion protein [Sphingomonas bacterium]|nr:putative hemolysin activation/secretion protein [Sphingomonas bacterium]